MVSRSEQAALPADCNSEGCHTWRHLVLLAASDFVLLGIREAQTVSSTHSQEQGTFLDSTHRQCHTNERVSVSVGMIRSAPQICVMD